MNYKIITDLTKLKEFIEWLPELKDNEKYYCCLFARKKYCKDVVKIRSDKGQLKRFLATKENLLVKIKQLEIQDSDYVLKDTPVPQEALALYISPNPRCLKKAAFQMLKKTADLIYNDNNYNIHAEAMSCIQRSKSKTYHVDFDIDTKDVDLSLMDSILPKKAYKILETRGGYHILVDISKVTEHKYWHSGITNIFPVDQTGDNMIPVPGTHQGGFTPYFK